MNLSKEEQWQRLQELLKSVRIVAGLAPLPRSFTLPEKDQPILQAALQAQATHLLTGDKRHFGKFYGRRLSGILILPPAEYLHQH